MIANRYNNPKAVFQDTVSAVLGNYNERRTGLTLQKITSISLDKLYSIYKERFSNAADFTFVFTGSFTAEEMRPLVEQYIASLPGNGATEQTRELNIHIPSGQITKTVYSGTEDQATVWMVFSGSFNYSPAETVSMLALRDIIQFRMIERLRETEGGVYSPSVQFDRNHTSDDRYQLILSFGCAPANVDKLIKAALEEIAKIKEDGAHQSELEKFYFEEQRQLETNLQENSYLSMKLQNNEDVKSILTQSQRIKSVTGKDIQKAARQYLSGSNLIKFIWLPVNNKM